MRTGAFNFLFFSLYFALVPNTVRGSICILGFYGRHGNRIITLANGLREAKLTNTTLVLDKKWSKWYKQWFDERADIQLDYSGGCERVVKAQTLFFKEPLNSHNHYIVNLQPKLMHWNAASKALPRVNSVTVHRRWFEGECTRRARKRVYFCLSELDYSDVCHWNHHKIYLKLQKLVVDNEIEYFDTVQLLTDGQKLKYDRSFHFDVKRRIQVEICMMALSTVHFGSSMSSIYYVIAHWRKGLQFPRECFDQLHG